MGETQHGFRKGISLLFSFVYKIKEVPDPLFTLLCHGRKLCAGILFRESKEENQYSTRWVNDKTFQPRPVYILRRAVDGL